MAFFFFLLHFSLIVFIVFLAVPATMGQNASYTSCSTLYSCGKIQGVGYPFWGENRPKYCGIQAYKLSCQNSTTRFNLFQGVDFGISVHGINTSSHTMEFSPDMLFKFCFLQGLQHRNYSILSKLQLVNVTYYNIKCFYGCADNCASKYKPRNFTCSTYSDGSNGTAYYFGEREPSEVSGISHNCSYKNNITFLVDKKGFDELGNTNASLQSILMRQRIEARYTPNFIACSKCEKSNGICGSSEDPSSDQFVCYCQDGPQPLQCSHKSGKKKASAIKLVVAVIVPILAMVLLIGLCTYHFRRKAKKYLSVDVKYVLEDFTTAESLMFDFGTLDAATNHFSDDRKLGGGGFGNVYKGTLPNGQEMAIKRLSRISGQGMESFKNEAVLIAKLQHKNLVKLLGFCLEGGEKLLVYEFVPNKSLNYLLFDPRKKEALDWPIRYNIITGIARGLLYLHEDSRPRIIHRDLKAANILLEADMNPKISDFGLARMFKVEQTEDDTSIICGTYGYMAPEYAMHGQFSIKSDVYSFGVLLLEIVSSMKINSRSHTFGEGDLLTHAWRSWKAKTPFEFMDPTLRDSCSPEEVLRCIGLGLSCVQESANERPTMSTIVFMLNTNSSTSSMPPPRSPRSFYCSSTESSHPTTNNQHNQ